MNVYVSKTEHKLFSCRNYATTQSRYSIVSRLHGDERRQRQHVLESSIHITDTVWYDLSDVDSIVIRVVGGIVATTNTES